MNSKEIIEKLEDDKHYYGKFGRQFLSNSDINTLIKGKPEDLYKPKKKTSDMLIGGYFHTIILEPEKVKSFKIRLFFTNLKRAKRAGLFGTT